MKRNLFTLGALLMAAAFTFTSCLSDGDDTIVLESGSSSGIPSDDIAGPNPDVEGSTTTIPNIQYEVETDGGDAIMRIDMTGIQDAEDYDWLRLIGTGEPGQNVWVEVDGKPKGIVVTNSSDNQNENDRPLVDMVFLVDNSGSMSQEANAIARDITSWSQGLASSGLDIMFGCVGYGSGVGSQYEYLVDGYGISGALDMTTSSVLDEYLNERGRTGTSRTVGYYGNYADDLQSVASNEEYRMAGGECGVQALWFADEMFHFRKGANRIYVNFTDDANYPATNDNISVYSVVNSGRWTTDKGTIHSVISNDTTSIKSRGEAPWLLSKYTGGTIIVAPSDFSGVTLQSLPVTGAMQNSYVIRFTNIGEFMDGQVHEVTITILSADGKTYAERTFYVVFGEAD